MLLDKNGGVLWTYAKDTGASDMATGDFDGDGMADFAIAVYGEGIQVLDGKGNEMWRSPVEDVWRVEAGDVDNDGKAEIILRLGWQYNGDKFLRGRGGRYGVRKRGVLFHRFEMA